MRKLTVIAALIALSFSAGAQSLNLSSAYEAQNRGYLKKAKGYIDQAAVHEQTKAEAQTWFYSTLIYCKIGGEIKDKSKQGKELAKIAPDWYRTAYQSVLNWKQFDKSGEYTEKITPFFAYIGGAYLDMVESAMNSGDYNLAMGLCDTAIQIFNMDAAGKSSKKNVQIARYYAGAAAYNSGNKEATKKYFNPLVKESFDNNFVYTTLFNIYKDEKDTVNAVKIANRFSKAFPNKFEADQMMAQAYLMSGNMEKAVECLNNSVAKQKDNPTVQAELLCAIAGVYDASNQMDKAIEKYNESLKLIPNQYDANYGMGSMMYNRAVDKINAANEVSLDDETGLAAKLDNEAKELFAQSEQYFKNAIAYLDGLGPEQENLHRSKLNNCLNALKTVYIRLEKTDDFKAVNDRILKLQAAASQN